MIVAHHCTVQLSAFLPARMNSKGLLIVSVKPFFTCPTISVPIQFQCVLEEMSIYQYIDIQVLFTFSMGFEVNLGTPPTPRPTQDPSITTTASKHIFQSWLLTLQSRSHSMHLRQVLTKTKIPYILKQQ